MQFRALAKASAVVCLPIPATPLNRNACGILPELKHALHDFNGAGLPKNIIKRHSRLRSGVAEQHW